MVWVVSEVSVEWVALELWVASQAVSRCLEVLLALLKHLGLSPLLEQPVQALEQVLQELKQIHLLLSVDLEGSEDSAAWEASILSLED